MTLGSSAPSGSTAPPGWHGEVGSESPGWAIPGVWKPPPGVHVQKSRTWRRGSAAIITRGGGEGYFRGEQHLIFLPLHDYGDAIIQVEGGATQRVPTAEPQTIGFRPAGVGIRTVIPASPYSFVAVFQDPAMYRDLAAEVTWPATPTDLEPQAVVPDAHGARLITALAEEMAGGSLDHLLIDALHIALALRIARHFFGPTWRPLSAGRLSRERLQRVLDYIEANLGSLALGDLAAVACLSPYHFCRCFARSLGVAPHRYVMGRRIAHARHLLLRSELSLTDIADAVGFDSQASFTARFTRELGVSPGRLRRERA